jgi:hypothetical protein
MLDAEKNIFQTTADQADALAKITGEGFVLAITAAYIAGMEAGKLAAQNTV